MAIITISRQIGSLGDEIARDTADTLGYEYIEKPQISEALSSLGFSTSEIDEYDEKKPSIWQTLSIQKDLFAHLIRVAVYEIASRNNVVIVGRGGQVILKGIPGTLHVRVIAPAEMRENRLMTQEGYEKKVAQRMIRQLDRDSSGYLSTYFNAGWNDSDLYDLVINTGTVSVKKSVAMITHAVDQIELSPQVCKGLHDLALSHRAQCALLRVTEKVDWTDLHFEKGVVYLSGMVRSAAIRQKCERTILNIEGIKAVHNQLSVRDKNSNLF